ncbi:hypothetical protein BPAE_0140g00090 [Botrytis paeoniae]|uniref:Uncharacterized protein n=1 Tax=Botrytis paeoniae TaxID=278948 RepID=A0A4Z1FKM6_9HELO|nr:hypothetical protein BPAE_0140g00090 [Botrytis paeoniae]
MSSVSLYVLTETLATFLDPRVLLGKFLGIQLEDRGTNHFTNEGIRDSLKARMPTKHHHEINDMTFGAIDQLEVFS